RVMPGRAKIGATPAAGGPEAMAGWVEIASAAVAIPRRCAENTPGTALLLGREAFCGIMQASTLCSREQSHWPRHRIPRQQAEDQTSVSTGHVPPQPRLVR